MMKVSSHWGFCSGLSESKTEVREGLLNLMNTRIKIPPQTLNSPSSSGPYRAYATVTARGTGC